MKSEAKVFISGKEFLPERKRRELTVALHRKKVSEVASLSEAEVVVVVIGGETTGRRCTEAREAGKAFFKMRVEMDSIFVCSLIGEAILPGDAAKWAWSIINEPEKWTRW